MGFVERDQSISLTGVERDAVFGLAVRPTHALARGVALEGDVELMLANASLWTVAATITTAGRTGVITPEVRAQIIRLLEDAIPEALTELEQTTRSRELWRAGVSDHGFPGLGSDETEARYAAKIERDRRVFHGLQSLSVKLDRTPGLAGYQAGYASRSSFAH